MIGSKVRLGTTGNVGEIIKIVEPLRPEDQQSFHVRFPKFVGTNIVTAELDFLSDDYEPPEVPEPVKPVAKKSVAEPASPVQEQINSLIDVQECRICNETKPFEQFNKSKASKTGRRNYCKSCAKSYVKK